MEALLYYETLTSSGARGISKKNPYLKPDFEMYISCVEEKSEADCKFLDPNSSFKTCYFKKKCTEDTYWYR